MSILPVNSIPPCCFINRPLPKISRMGKRINMFSLPCTLTRQCIFLLPYGNQKSKWELKNYSFLPPRSSLLARYAEVLRPLGDIRAAGRRWAARAARGILKDIDQPTFESVQTCEMLSLYWFSLGDEKRNAMFLSMAKERFSQNTAR